MAVGACCRYCGIHSASCVVKCVKTNKWFCNGRVTGTASCILTHLVKQALACEQEQHAFQPHAKMLASSLVGPSVRSFIPNGITALGPSLGIRQVVSAVAWVQVKAKVREVQLHRDSPLGDTLLECYSCGSRNTFGLGFVPVKSENSVVLLCRDHNASASGIKELNLDLSLWQPLIEDRAFMPWLVKQPTPQVQPTSSQKECPAWSS